MSFVVNNISKLIASWVITEPQYNNKLENSTILRAARENKLTSFYITYPPSMQFEKVVAKVQGWIEPADIEWNPHQMASFYQQLKPILSNDRSQLVFTFFQTTVTDVRSKLQACALLYINENTFHLELQKEGIAYPISSKDIVGVPEHFWQPIAGKISASALAKAERLSKYLTSIEEFDLKELKVRTAVIKISAKRFGTEKIISFNANRLDTIKEVQERVQFLGQIDPTALVMLRHNGQLLDSRHTVAECNLPTDVSLTFNLQFPGTALLPFVSLEKTKILDLDPGNPTWRTAKPGLTLIGKCYNFDCKAYNDLIWIPKGFGSFNLNKECVTSCCPCCNEEAIEAYNCGVYSCVFSIDGERNDKAHIKHENKQAPNNALMSFEGKRETLTEWRYLNIKVTASN